MSTKKRLDLYLVERGLCKSRTAAQRAIVAGLVFVNGQRVDKPATPVAEDAHIELKERPRYASQGGFKLEKALHTFHVDVQRKTCLDIGASTGGFTDCLLQHGAAKVYAVDVGKGQLDWNLRNDPRVVVMEDVNARYLQLEQIGEYVDLVTIDVSFISLRLILPAANLIVKPAGDVIALVKPQFEAGREHVQRGGVVKDPEVHRQVLEELAQSAMRELGFSVMNATFSPFKGPAGNIEFFLQFVNESGVKVSLDFESLVAEAHHDL
ncbi:MAG: RNA methyltransferase [Candidatus Fraserbacteria bacterium RBG_16_55_9]|uniref:RNA methyltransferase n=1 Tax=Fraserbacteria sp. (strain RBG_16_55_9) TaxID=1817864 RepID=A0A1F5UX32_FRAXR|nr:MAG: RNA methyltransferase [Candidatus Fraserbacteria bacterium RBG_16_55_9]